MTNSNLNCLRKNVASRSREMILLSLLSADEAVSGMLYPAVGSQYKEDGAYWRLTSSTGPWS